MEESMSVNWRDNPMSHWPDMNKSRRPQLAEDIGSNASSTAAPPDDSRLPGMLPDSRHGSILGRNRHAQEYRDRGQPSGSGGKYKRWKD
jgi:hypothetical protein